MTARPIGDRTAPEHLPGAALSREIAAGEHVEKEIDAFISKRHRDRIATEGERQAEEHWKVSKSAYFARRDEEMRTAWREASTIRARPRATGPSSRLSSKATRSRPRS